MNTSPGTLLRRVRNTTLSPPPTPRVLGVDDWALRRGQRYGTILCDLERRRPIELLPERSAESLQSWLQEHPGVEIISRDRADDYVKGSTAGAPQAVQVADRWHLLKNAREALTHVAHRHHASLQQAAKAAAAAWEAQRPDALPPPVSEPLPELARLTHVQERSQQRRQRRRECYEQVLELYRQNVSLREIARRLKLDRGTVRRYVAAGSFPEHASPVRKRRVDPFLDYLQRRWEEGCQNAVQLTKELRARGFKGSCYLVRRCVAPWRTGPANGRSVRSSERLSRLTNRPSATRIAWLLLKPEGEREAEEQMLVTELIQHCPELAAAAELTREFFAMVRQRRACDWEAWSHRAREPSAPAELRRFAEGLKAEEASITAALELPWSNGPVEGQINRLKTLKRQMYGRAKFDLLRQRFHAA